MAAGAGLPAVSAEGCGAFRRIIASAWARWAALATTIVTFLLSLYAWSRFDPSTSAFQLT